MVRKIEKDPVTEIPRVPLWTLWVVMAVIVGTVILDFTFGTSTNILIFFMVTTILPVMIIVLAVVPLDKFSDYLGFDVGKHKWMIIVYIMIGLLVGGGIYFLLAKNLASIGIIPFPMGYVLYASTLSVQSEPALTMLGILIMTIVIALGEEILRKFLADAFGSRLPKLLKTKDKVTVLIVGFMLSSLVWALSHVGAYSVVQNLPIQSYIMLYMIGTMFIMTGFIGFFLKGTKYYFGEYVIWSSLTAHFVYDFLIFSHYYLASVAPTSVLAFII